MPSGFQPRGTTTAYFTDTGEKANPCSSTSSQLKGFRTTQHLTADFAASLMTFMNDL